MGTLKRAFGGAALVIAASIGLGMSVGCGTNGSGRDGAAVMARADAVVVTYYYLPG